MLTSARANTIATLRPATELAETRQHGDRLKYMAGCRCCECRRANTDYESQRAKARKAGDWNGIVPAAAARAHVLALSKLGVGRRQISDAAGVAESIMVMIIQGKRVNIRARSERAILAVTREAAADHAVIDAGPTWKLLDDLLSCGYTKAELARELGYESPALQIKRTHCIVRTAFEVHLLHARLRCVPAGKTKVLIASLREEGYRADRITSMLQELALRLNVPAPDLTLRADKILASTATLVQRLHDDLMEEVPA